MGNEHKEQQPNDEIEKQHSSTIERFQSVSRRWRDMAFIGAAMTLIGVGLIIHGLVFNPNRNKLLLNPNELYPPPLTEMYHVTQGEFEAGLGGSCILVGTLSLAMGIDESRKYRRL